MVGAPPLVRANDAGTEYLYTNGVNITAEFSEWMNMGVCTTADAVQVRLSRECTCVVLLGMPFQDVCVAFSGVCRHTDAIKMRSC